MKVRLDKLLLERGVTTSRERAQALILAGKVLVNGQKVEKAGAGVDGSAEIRLLGEDLKYVSRGGLKLEEALRHWQIDVRDKVCLDVGTSTGGFTDCLLQRGAGASLRSIPATDRSISVSVRTLASACWKRPMPAISRHNRSAKP